MSLNLYDILKEVVIGQDVMNAIDNKEQVIINYSDEENRAPGKRLIEPYAYGLSKAGNEVLRAYQYEGDTFRGKPKWKFFRLDRIESWNPTGSHFNVEPNKHGWQAEDYNSEGDNSMISVIKQVKFNDNVDPSDKLGLLRKKTERMQQSNPISLDQMVDNKKGAIDPPTATNTQTTPTNSPYKGALDTTKIQKDNSYWDDFDAAEKEMNKQNYKDKYNTKRREDRWQNAVNNRKFWRKGALNDFEDNEIEND